MRRIQQIPTDDGFWPRQDGSTDFHGYAKNSDFGKGATIVSIVLPTSDTLRRYTDKIKKPKKLYTISHEKYGGMIQK